MSDIKNTLSSAIADMRGSRIQKYMLRDLHHRIEDLDNCGSRRRHNFHMRGLLESVMSGQLEATTLVMFNNLLERPPDSPLELEWFHRELRPRGDAADLPRDVICCIACFSLKEERSQM